MTNSNAKPGNHTRTSIRLCEMQVLKEMNPANSTLGLKSKVELRASVR